MTALIVRAFGFLRKKEDVSLPPPPRKKDVPIAPVSLVAKAVQEKYRAEEAKKANLTKRTLRSVETVLGLDYRKAAVVTDEGVRVCGLLVTYHSEYRLWFTGAGKEVSSLAEFGKLLEETYRQVEI